MKKHFFIIVLLLLFALTTGCKKSIVGKWKALEVDDEYYYIFNKDKTCSYEMTIARLDCTYEDDGSKLTVLYNGSTKPNIYEYRFDGSILIIKDIAGKDYKFFKE